MRVAHLTDEHLARLREVTARLLATGAQRWDYRAFAAACAADGVSFGQRTFATLAHYGLIKRVTAGGRLWQLTDMGRAWVG